MRRLPVVFGFGLVGLVAGCGGPSSSATSSAPPAAANVCTTLAPVGPLIGYTYQMQPPNPSTGGPLTDGFYDLVQIIQHGKATGEWSSDMAPAIRWVLLFTTDTRSPNHSEGRIDSTMNLPPASKCDEGRFAIFVGSPELRWTDKKGKLDGANYTTTPDGSIFLVKDRVTYVFRRRR